MAEIYKRISNVDADNRTQTAISNDDKATIQNILGSFIQYFKAKHLS